MFQAHDGSPLQKDSPSLLNVLQSVPTTVGTEDGETVGESDNTDSLEAHN